MLGFAPLATATLGGTGQLQAAVIVNATGVQGDTALNNVSLITNNNISVTGVEGTTALNSVATVIGKNVKCNRC
jgi:hypothetical protein